MSNKEYVEYLVDHWIRVVYFLSDKMNKNSDALHVYQLIDAVKQLLISTNELQNIKNG